MRIVGLTGGMGSGKSTVAKIFSNLGVPVYNSDIEAKRLMQSSKKVKKQIVSLLGKDAYEQNKLNRAYIAQKIFNDKKLLEELNGIVHPAVREHFLAWTKKQSHPYVIQETALIFENGMSDFYDSIILVTAPKEMRIQRIMDRDAATREEITARMENQLEDSEKIALADFVIQNIELSETALKIEEVNNALLEFC
ncbi:dephospho-CoA kinase [Maribacter sp. 2210JD10-5]|uniref:dephospho-CoA kinase n=1 Tax=Maribacter sp. 2210JD10-5 TaxID=3386272 RepID=UPI0039BCE1EF